MNPLLQKYLQAKAQAVQQKVGQFAQNAQQFAPQAFKAVTNPVGFVGQQVAQNRQPIQNFVKQQVVPQVSNFMQEQRNKPIAPWGPSMQQINNVMNGGKSGGESFAEGLVQLSKPGPLTDTGIGTALTLGPGVVNSVKSKISSRMGKNMPKVKGQQVLDQAGKILEETKQIPTKLLKQKGARPTLSLQADLPIEQMGQSSIPPTGVQATDSLAQSVSQTGKRPPQTLNANRLDMGKKSRAMIEEITEDKLKQVLSNDEVIKLAQTAGFDTKSYGLDGTRKLLAEQLNSRRQVVELEKNFRAMQQSGASEDELARVFDQLAETGNRVRAARTEAGRVLQAGNILATDINTPMQRVIQLMDAAGVDPKAYRKEAMSINWDDANQVVSFYRKHVPAKWHEWLDTLRYNSMLSSPLTHITNIFSNTLNTGVVAPIEKTIAGGIDFLASSVTGKPRTQFAGEGLAHAQGYVANIGKAAHRFMDVLRGARLSENMDMRQLPLAVEGTKGKIATKLSYPTKLLEAADQFFTALTEGAETASLKYRQAKGGKVMNIGAQAKANAEYRVFRGELKDPRQGHLLNAIDEVTGSIMKLRNSSNRWASIPAKFTLPFVKTPMNILKQGIEYTPAGLATLPGAANKTEQLSKVVFGMVAMAATSMMTASGRTTWAEPTDEKKRAAFRAAGMQPYAVKIGDQWVSYSKLPPALSFPIAIVAAFHDAEENKLITDSELDKWLTAIAKTGNFFADQSYLKNIGDIVATAKGDAESMTRFISNYPQQLVPYRALLSWMGKITDPLQRKVDRNAPWYEQQVQQLMMQLPFLSQMTPARLDQFGQPIQNQNPGFNAFSPLRMTTEDPAQREIYDLMQTKTRMTRDRNAIKDSLERGVVPDALVASANETQMQPEFEGSLVSNPLAPPISTAMTPAQQMMQDQKIAIIKDKLQYGGNITPEEKQLVLTNPQQPQLSGDEGIDKQLISDFNSELTAKSKLAGDMYKAGALSKEEASKYIAQFTTAKISTKDEAKAKKAEMDAQYSLDADMLKRNKDTQGWITTTEAYVKQLEEYKATLTDRTDQIRVQNRINDLTTQLGKYKGQGGFTKGRKLKGKILKLKLPKSKKIKTRRVKLTQPNFNTKSDKPKGIQF